MVTLLSLVCTLQICLRSSQCAHELTNDRVTHRKRAFWYFCNCARPATDQSRTSDRRHAHRPHGCKLDCACRGRHSLHLVLAPLESEGKRIVTFRASLTVHPDTRGPSLRFMRSRATCTCE